jgi:hypothetical protein
MLPVSQARVVEGAHARNGERPELFSATVEAWCARGEVPERLVDLAIA